MIALVSSKLLVAPALLDGRLLGSNWVAARLSRRVDDRIVQPERRYLDDMAPKGDLRLGSNCARSACWAAVRGLLVFSDSEQGRGQSARGHLASSQQHNIGTAKGHESLYMVRPGSLAGGCFG